MIHYITKCRFYTLYVVWECSDVAEIYLHGDERYAHRIVGCVTLYICEIKETCWHIHLYKYVAERIRKKVKKKKKKKLFFFIDGSKEKCAIHPQRSVSSIASSAVGFLRIIIIFFHFYIIIYYTITPFCHHPLPAAESKRRKGKRDEGEQKHSLSLCSFLFFFFRAIRGNSSGNISLPIYECVLVLLYTKLYVLL